MTSHQSPLCNSCKQFCSCMCVLLNSVSGIAVKAGKVLTILHAFSQVLANVRLKNAWCVLQLLGLPAASLRSFVLDSDPIPRAMLSIDPTFAFVKQWPAVKNIMQVGRWFMGQQTPVPVSPAKFMYNNVGEVYLIKWTVGQGHKVSSTCLVRYSSCFRSQSEAVQSWTLCSMAFYIVTAWVCTP